MDLAGKKFGRLTVLRRDPEPYRSPSGKPTPRWRCRCDCGKEIIVLQNTLTDRRRHDQSCGCARTEATRRHAKDMTGQRFGRLTVVGAVELDKPQPNGTKLGWLCRCDCGKEVIATRKNLLSGKKLSCGCLLAESATARVDDAVGHVEGTTLSAIRPERRPNKNNKSGVKGVHWSKADGCWIAKIGVKGRTVYIGRFSSLEEAARARRDAEEKYFRPILDRHKK